MSNLIRINNKLMTKNNKLLTTTAYVPPTALAYNNNLLRFNNYVIDPNSTPVPPSPQEIIIPPSLIADDGLNYDINDIPLNTPITFSYTSYSGYPGEPPTYIQFGMNTSNWSAYEFSEMISLTDKAATFTVTDKKNYNNFMIILYKPNGSDPILISNISGYKLSYMG